MRESDYNRRYYLSHKDKILEKKKSYYADIKAGRIIKGMGINKWTTAEDNFLREKYGFYMAARQISDILHKGASTIRHRVIFLGLSSKERTVASIKRANSHPDSVFTKEKKRLSHIGMKHSDAVKRKISLAHIGMKYSDEVRARISLGKKNNMTEKTRAKLRLVNKGRYHSEERRKKTGLAIRARYVSMSPEDREILREKYREVFKKKCRNFNRIPTDIEKKIILQLDNIGERYIFQHFICGKYYDFFLVDRNLLIECDGDYWHSFPWVQKKDMEKDVIAKQYGHNMIRILGSRINEENFIVGDFIGR